GEGNKPRVAAVGPASAEAVREAGVAVEYVANTHHGVGLADELGERLRGMNVLLPRSDHANQDLPRALRRHGARVTEVIAYRTLRPYSVDASRLAKIAADGADAVLFFSQSAGHHFEELLGVGRLRGLQHRLAIVAIGPVTAAALEQVGIQRMVVAAEVTSAAVVQELEEHFSGAVKPSPAGAKRG